MIDDRFWYLALLLGLISLTNATTTNFVFIKSYNESFTSESVNNYKYFDFMTGGFKRVFWFHNWTNYELKFPNKCVQSVLRVQNEIGKGSLFAFSMVDASGSTPSGFLTGSFASLGDFDQCLKVTSDSLNFHGKYCLLELSLKNQVSPLQARESVEGSLQSVIPLLDFFLPRMSLCVPSSCTSRDVLNMIRDAMSTYPFEVTNKVSCQTHYSKSPKFLNKTQSVSIAFLAFMWTLVSVTTILRYLVPDEASTFTEIFCMQSNFRKLFYRSEGQAIRNRAIDQLKLIFSLMFISMHAIGGTDNPFSPLLIGKMADALEDSSRPELQIFFSENLAEIMFLLTGYVTVTSIVSFLNKLTIEKRSSFNLIASFMFSKWLRVAPLVFSLLALEFVWPFLSNGPFYPEASNFILTNCYNYWWSNVLLLANWFPSIEKCCPQLFHSCVDFQLTFLAIGVILLLSKSIKAGLLVSLTLTIVSMVKLYHNAWKYSVIPNYVSKGATLMQRMQYLDVIQLATFAHLPAYILGVLCAYKAITRKQIFIPQSVGKIASYTCYLLTAAAVFGPVLHNSTNLLSKSMVPLYIVLQKLFFVFALLPILLPLRQLKGKCNYPLYLLIY